MSLFPPGVLSGPDQGKAKLDGPVTRGWREGRNLGGIKVLSHVVEVCCFGFDFTLMEKKLCDFFHPKSFVVGFHVGRFEP